MVIATTVLAVHLAAPWVQPLQYFRDDIARFPTTLREAAARNAGSGAVIVAGDLNSTYDMQPFRNLLDEGYRDAAEQAGAGLTRSYPEPAVARADVRHRPCAGPQLRGDGSADGRGARIRPPRPVSPSSKFRWTRPPADVGLGWHACRATAIYVASPEGDTGKSTIALGILHRLAATVAKVGVFRPITRLGEDRDYILELLLAQATAGLPYEDCVGVSYQQLHEDPDAAHRLTSSTGITGWPTSATRC